MHACADLNLNTITHDVLSPVRVLGLYLPVISGVKEGDDGSRTGELTQAAKNTHRGRIGDRVRGEWMQNEMCT